MRSGVDGLVNSCSWRSSFCGCENGCVSEAADVPDDVYGRREEIEKRFGGHRPSGGGVMDDGMIV
jgi:hypothetical protein